MSDDLDFQLIDRFLAGEATVEESARVQQWIGESSERRALIEGMVAQRSALARESFDVETAWHRVREKTIATERKRSTVIVQPLRPSRPWFSQPWVLAAAGIGAIVVGSFVWRGVRVQETENARTTTTVAAATWRDASSPRGKRSTVRLPDGSVVVLNSGSGMRYAIDSARGARRVELIGEGYFTVTHDSARPFSVRAARATVTDVGTRFVVRAYDSAAVTVVVADGSVDVARTEGSLTASIRLTRGDVAVVPAAGAINRRRADPSKYVAFAEERLVLDDVTLEEAVRRMERWYDVKIVIADPSLVERRVSAEFHNETLQAALEGLALTFDASTRQRGGTWVIAAKRGSQ